MLAVKVAVVVFAETLTAEGTLRIPLALVETATIEPPLGAALDVVIVQVVFEFDPSVLAAQDKDEISTEADNDRFTLWVEPLRDAEIVAVRSADRAPVVIVNATVVVLAASVTDDGAVRTPLIPPETTTVVPDGMALDTVTVQVVLELEDRVVDAHDKEEISGEADNDSFTLWLDPLSDADSVAV